MKNLKIISLIIFCLLLSGCSVKYNLIIENDIVSEKLELYADSKYETYVADMEENLCERYKIQEKEYMPALNKSKLPIDYEKKEDGIEYYNIRYIETDETCKLYYDFKYNYKDLKKATTTSQYINSFSVNQIDGNYIITAQGFNFVEIFNGINEVEVIITTPYPVIENNADNINNNSYIWNINKSNYKSKIVEITIKNGKEKIEETKEQIQPITTAEKIKENVKYIIGAIAFIFVSIVAYVVTSKKQNKY